MPGSSYSQAEADLAHLRPKRDALEFGILCGAGVGALLGVFCWLAGLDLNRFGLPGAAVIGLAFLFPWLHYRSQWKAYYSAVLSRVGEIDREKGA